MLDEPESMGLVDALDVLRAELAEARRRAAHSGVVFEIQTLTVEFKVGLTRSADGRAGFKVPLLGAELGASGNFARETVQTVTMVLGPPVDQDGRPLKVADSGDELKG